jgi:hypothetical protein
MDVDIGRFFIHMFVDIFCTSRRYVPFDVLSHWRFFHLVFLTIRPFVPIGVFSNGPFVPFGVFPFNVLSHSAFCLSTFCRSTFFTFDVCSFDILSVNHKNFLDIYCLSNNTSIMVSFSQITVPQCAG